MITVFRNQNISPDDPAIVWAVTDSDSFLVDPESIAFAIKDASGVKIYPEEEDFVEVDLSANRLGKGRFVIPWHVGGAIEEGIYRLEVEWTVAGIVKKAWREIEATAVDYGLRGDHYCFIADLIEHGVIESDGNKMRAARLINNASQTIRDATQRFFHAEYQDRLLDHRSGRLVSLPDPIIGLESFEYDETAEEDRDFIAVYARHLQRRTSGGMDDRDNPKIMLDYRLPDGDQIIRIKGLFGYTDPDGSCDGKTPEAIREACVALVFRSMPEIGTDSDEREERAKRGFMISEKTHSQSYNLDPKAVSAGLTGDREIDDILGRYQKPFSLGVL